jgi:hypothetical protein
MLHKSLQPVRFILPLVAFALMMISCSSFVSAQVTNRVVALSGDIAPGTNERFDTFANPVINATGDVAFQANITGNVIDVVPHGLWAGSQSTLRPLVIAGQTAPDTEGSRFQMPGWPLVLTSDGEGIFYGNLVHENGVSSENDYGIWAFNSGGTQLVARRSDPAPGLPADVSYSLLFANPHTSGLMGFSSSLAGPGIDASNNTAAWLGPTGPSSSLRLIARAGDTAPGLPVGSQFTGIGTPWVNARGHFVLPATAATSNPTAAQVQGIWAEATEQFHLVVAGQTPAPGTSGRNFGFFGELRLNNAGNVVFAATLQSVSDEERLSDTGIWSAALNTSVVLPVAIEGQQAPGFGAGVVFRGSAPGEEPFYDAFGQPVLGGNGSVAFAATVFGNGTDFDHNDGIWISEPVSALGPPNLTLLAREGDQPPGTPDGTRFMGLNFGDDLIPAFERPLINGAGHVAFEALTTGPLGEMGRGIWATDAAGALLLVAHTGDDFTIAPGDVRTIDVLKLHAGGSSDDGYLSALNDRGELAFAVLFADGSEAVVVATVVPEPATLWYLVVAGLCARLFKVRRARGER